MQIRQSSAVLVLSPESSGRVAKRGKSWEAHPCKLHFQRSPVLLSGFLGGGAPISVTSSL